MDSFCYTIQLDKGDRYRFNKARRQVPEVPTVQEEGRVVEGVCEEKCRAKVGGMEMLKGEALAKTTGARAEDSVGKWSHISRYLELDALFVS